MILFFKILIVILFIYFIYFIYFNYQLKQNYQLENSIKDPVINVVNNEEKKIAFLFLVYDELNNPDLWIEFFRGIDKSKYNIYIHYKNDVDLHEFNCYKLKNCVPTEWGKISLVKAQNVLLKEAMKDPCNNYFIFLSNSCIPLKPFNFIYNKLYNNTKSIFSIFYKTKSFFSIFYKTDDDQVFPRYNQILKFTKKDNIKKNSQWCILCRKHVELLLRDEEIYFSWYDNVTIPDESAYLTYLNSKNLSKEIILIKDQNKNTTFVNWYQKYKFNNNNNINGYPKTYKNISVDEINFLISSPCFFARKFTKNFENKNVIYDFLKNSKK